LDTKNVFRSSSMEERLENTGLHRYEINKNIYVYEEVEMG
jgi:hypothetical protein